MSLVSIAQFPSRVFPGSGDSGRFCLGVVLLSSSILCGNYTGVLYYTVVVYWFYTVCIFNTSSLYWRCIRVFSTSILHWRSIRALLLSMLSWSTLLSLQILQSVSIVRGSRPLSISHPESGNSSSTIYAKMYCRRLQWWGSFSSPQLSFMLEYKLSASSWLTHTPKISRASSTVSRS